jgi:hypothetical protein
LLTQLDEELCPVVAIVDDAVESLANVVGPALSKLSMRRPIAGIARELRIHEGTLATWFRRYRDQSPVEEKPLRRSAHTRLAEPERENPKLRV